MDSISLLEQNLAFPDEEKGFFCLENNPLSEVFTQALLWNESLYKPHFLELYSLVSTFYCPTDLHRRNFAVQNKGEAKPSVKCSKHKEQDNTNK